MITVNSVYDLRRELGWTQTELADAIKKDQSTISTYEKGGTIPFWTLKKLKQLALKNKISLDISE